MPTTEPLKFTQDEFKIMATMAIHKVIMDIDEVKEFATKAALNLSLEVVPVDWRLTAVKT